MKKILTVGMVLGLCMLATGCKDRDYKVPEIATKETTVEAEERIDYKEKEAFLEKENGWIYSMTLVLEGDEENAFFGGENIRYQKVENCYVPMLSSEGEEVDRISIKMPHLINCQDKAEEVSKISDFFTKKAFGKKISLKDLDELVVEKIDKKDLVTLYNNACDREYSDVKSPNDFGHLEMSNCIVKELRDGTKVQCSYVLGYRRIGFVNFELVNKEGVVLTDLIEQKKATKEEQQLYDNFQKISKRIIETQRFGCSKDFVELNNEVYNKVFDILEELESNSVVE